MNGITPVKNICTLYFNRQHLLLNMLSCTYCSYPITGLSAWVIHYKLMKQIGAGALEETFMLRGPLESSLEMLENLDEVHCLYAPGKT